MNAWAFGFIFNFLFFVIILESISKQHYELGKNRITQMFDGPTILFVSSSWSIIYWPSMQNKKSKHKFSLLNQLQLISEETGLNENCVSQAYLKLIWENGTRDEPLLRRHSFPDLSNVKGLTSSVVWNPLHPNFAFPWRHGHAFRTFTSNSGFACTKTPVLSWLICRSFVEHFWLMPVINIDW